MLKKYSTELQAALGFLALQFLFKITFELDGASKITSVPVIQIVLFVLPMLILTITLCLLRQRSGYILGIIYSLLHIPLVLSLIVMSKIPEGYSLLRPINVMVTCSLIAYFSYREYTREGKEAAKKTISNSTLIALYLNLCWLSCMAISIFTDFTRRVIDLPGLNGGVLNNPFMATFLIFSGITTIGLIIFVFLEKAWIYKVTIAFGAIQIIALIGLLTASQVTPLVMVLGSVFALLIVVFALLDSRKKDAK